MPPHRPRCAAVLGIACLLGSLACGSGPCSDGCLLLAGTSYHGETPGYSLPTRESAAGSAVLLYKAAQTTGRTGAPGVDGCCAVQENGRVDLFATVPATWSNIVVDAGPDAAAADADGPEAGPDGEPAATKLGEPSSDRVNGRVAWLDLGTNLGPLIDARIVFCDDPRETLAGFEGDGFHCLSAISSPARSESLTGTATSTTLPSDDPQTKVVSIEVLANTGYGTTIHVLLRRSTAMAAPHPDCY